MPTTVPLPRRATRAVPAGPVRIALPGRTLLLVAGVPGAGKSTLLASLSPDPDVAVLDSEEHRAALAAALGRSGLSAAVPYRRYRALVHLRHRVAVVRAALSAVPTVVVHLPATAAGTRAAIVRLAALTGRAAHLLWLHADPADALRGQHDRGRVVPAESFAEHADRGHATTAELRAGRYPDGWSSVSVLDRRRARDGLRLDTGTRPAGGK